MIYIIVGTRPNYIKAFPLYKYLKSQNVDIQMIHSNQHYDNNLNQIFFHELNISIDEITFLNKNEDIFSQLMLLIKENKPNYIMVFGDVNTSLYGAIAGIHNNIPIIHIEAGLRSYDNTMVEELNRKAIDSISSYHFCTERGAIINLEKENIKGNVYYVGNTMIDTLVENIDKIKRMNYFENYNLIKKNYIICTLHRQSNVDNPIILDYIMMVLNEISEKIKIVIPLHPRTSKNVNKNKYTNILFIEPLSYLQFMSMVYYSNCVITDSGGIQEETTFLNKKCLTLRKNTERPITIIEGTNRLINCDYDSIMDEINKEEKKNVKIDYWDGNSSKRIYDILKMKINL
jgi:UDP-N-acetylglucosamine 2-epimerase (non-hydrolysing)